MTPEWGQYGSLSTLPSPVASVCPFLISGELVSPSHLNALVEASGTPSQSRQSLTPKDQEFSPKM